MKVRDSKTHLIIRLEKGEEVVSTIVDICKEYNVKLGVITGIGAVNYAEVGYFDVEKKKYYSNEFKGNLEILSLMGNITNKDGEVYIHPHLTFADEEGNAKGGHLNKAIISATGEIIIEKIDDYIGRVFSDEIGLNLMDI